MDGEEVAHQTSRGVRVGVMVRHPAPLPHDEIQQLFPDVYAVRGTFQVNALVSISRTMTVQRPRIPPAPGVTAVGHDREGYRSADRASRTTATTARGASFSRSCEASAGSAENASVVSLDQARIAPAGTTGS